ncbi:hypothetical protein PCC7424_1071 [Gloeothece citriformis PCC 7424]|uniref:Uncharacterized protein n=1 Tax=Gloeothece citriformis (strain PCC 7424) TaxID=65393 RepID=B7KJS5_GLOC7|nr:hypothetical protein [Gloeothece citriformis]ACK69524.1 hypothetical protein PCC7424_1071 [Gloeothece citriformis PCC 7424]
MKVEAKFTSQEAVHNAQNQIQLAGIPSEQMSIRTQSYVPRTQIPETQTVRSASSAAIAGAVLGGLVGFFLSFVTSNIPDSVTFFGTHNSKVLTLLITLMGSIIGASGFGLIGALSGISVPKTVPNSYQTPENYLVIVEGDENQIEKVAEILKQQGGQQLIMDNG